jgi:hypothetical protein
MINLLDRNVVQKLLQEAFSPEEDRYRRSIDSQWKILRGNLNHFVSADLQRIYPKTYASFTATDINLAKKITHKRSQAYKKNPIRVLDKEVETNTYQDLMEEIDALKVLRTHDAYYNFFKYSCVWFNYYETAEKKQKIILRALRPNQFKRRVNHRGETEVFLVFFGETESSAVRIEGDGKRDAFQGAPEDRKSTLVGMWSKDHHVLVNVKLNRDQLDFDYEPIEGNQTNVNPLGMIPAMFSQEGDEQDRPALNNLANQTVALNTMLSTIITGMNAQAFGQLVIKYPESQKMPDIVQQGMMTFLKLPQIDKDSPATEADYITPTPDLANALNVFYSYVSAILDEHQITVSSIKGDVQKFTSGLDRMLAQADTNEVIEANQEIYSQVEKDLYLLVKKFSEQKSQYSFKSASLMVKYYKPNPMMSEKEILENSKVKLDLGIIEAHEILQALDPNVSDKDAIKRIAEIKAKGKDVVESLKEKLESETDKEMEFISANKQVGSDVQSSDS